MTTKLQSLRKLNGMKFLLNSLTKLFTSTLLKINLKTKASDKSDNFGEQQCPFGQINLEELISEVIPMVQQFAPMLFGAINELKGDCEMFREGRCPRSNYHMLHRRAYDCLGSKDPIVILEGKNLLLKLLECFPNDRIGLYNLACAESLLGNVDQALSVLEKAIDVGYRDFDHILNDTDFDNIKNHDGFKRILGKYINLNEIKTDQVEEKKEEPKKEEIKIEVSKIEEPKKEQDKELETVSKLLNDMGFDIPSNVLKELLSNGERLQDIVNELLI